MVANISILYVINYIILVIIIYALICSKRSSVLLTEVSLSSYLSYINKYTNIKKVMNIVFLILSGLAPTSNFFFKMSIFLYLSKSSNITVTYMFLLIVVLNTTYYLQPVYVREEVDIDPAIIRKIMDSKDHKSIIKNKFLFWYLTIWYFLFNFFFIIFNTDIFIIFLVN